MQRVGDRAVALSSVTTPKQGVVLGRVLAADASGSRLQLTERFEGDAKAFGSHGWSTRFQILIPEIKTYKNSIHWSCACLFFLTASPPTSYLFTAFTWPWSSWSSLHSQFPHRMGSEQSNRKGTIYSVYPSFQAVNRAPVICSHPAHAQMESLLQTLPCTWDLVKTCSQRLF